MNKKEEADKHLPRRRLIPLRFQLVDAFPRKERSVAERVQTAKRDAFCCEQLRSRSESHRFRTLAIPQRLCQTPLRKRACTSAFPGTPLPTPRDDASALPSLSVANSHGVVNLAGCAVCSKASCSRLKNYSWGAKMRQVGHGQS